MDTSVSMQQKLITLTNATALSRIEIIQGVWGGYGQLYRAHFVDGEVNSVVVKQISLPQPSEHPKGWNTQRSHQRKLASYQVELNWYQYYAKHCPPLCPVAEVLAVEQSDTDILLVLSDLTQQGFPVVKQSATLEEVKVCIRWLARFHAKHLGVQADELWKTGAYWHLETRPDEFAAMPDSPLKQAASQLNQRLLQCKYQTLVHGDAKLANFCFSTDGSRVAAVDFQYVGQGCGMKDLILFISSCIPPEQCQKLEQQLIDYYFAQLSEALNSVQPQINPALIEKEWRPLYAIAWADFQRFVTGWSPKHWKINPYTEQLTERALQQINK